MTRRFVLHDKKLDQLGILFSFRHLFSGIRLATNTIRRKTSQEGDETMANTTPTHQAEQNTPLQQRRQFLKGLAGASAVAGLASASTLALAEQAKPAIEAQQRQPGYQETDHIRAYYASCR